ncbi:oligosaccharide flippase family protein [Sporolactobacillus pectinivorans]|uniref:oligosaccharide flippase family protein n=1 Tax=Sporolactobacillus pectinivorans TaxID=1591408 RepID=UPI001EFD3DAB|nr:oligosaccharide flippase family protein [Sporolactobacillus pectinivorans]
MRRNYMYTVLYQCTVMLVPLITVPYVSRVLLPEGIGVFAYTSSIAQYFSLIGMLGIGVYGNKIIAMSRDDKKEMSRNFFGIYCLQIFLSALSILGYLALVFLFIHSERQIAMIQTIALLGTLADCTWFFSGLELFGGIVLRNTLIKVVGLIAIFIFVKHAGDLALYTWIMCLSTFLGQLVMWFYVRKLIVRVHLSFRSVLKHIRPTLVYFLPEVALQIYFVLDKTMIGLLSTKSEVGIYDYSDKIQKMALSVVTSLGTVMLPRMTHTFASGQFNRAKHYIMKSLDFSTLLGIPITFGLAGIAKEFVPWYMGDSFMKCVTVLILISPTIFLMAWSGVFGSQYLVPLGKMKEYTLSLYAGAIVNFTVNLFLIRSFGSIGASIGTLAAELSVTLVQIYFIKNIIPFKKILPRTVIYLFAGAVMYLLVRAAGQYLGSSIITTVVQIGVGSCSYLMIIMVCEYFMKGGILLNELKKRMGWINEV